MTDFAKFLGLSISKFRAKAKFIAKICILTEDKNGDKSVKGFLLRTFSNDITNQTDFLINARKFNC